VECQFLFPQREGRGGVENAWGLVVGGPFLRPQSLDIASTAWDVYRSGSCGDAFDLQEEGAGLDPLAGCMVRQRDSYSPPKMSSDRSVSGWAAHGLHRRASRLHWPYFLSLIFVFLAVTLDYYDAAETPIILLFAASIVLSFSCENRNFFHLSLMGGHYAFWIFPVLVLRENGIYTSIVPLALCVYGVTLALYITQGYTHHNAIKFGGQNIGISYKYFIMIYVMLTTILITTSGQSFILTIMILIVSYALFIENRRLLSILFSYACVILYILIYSYFYWDGFGRLIIFSSILGTTLILLKSFTVFYIEKWIVFFLMGFGALAGTYFRMNASSLSEALAASLQDSNISPIELLTNIYMYVGTSVKNFHGWVDQFILFFTAGVPRALWPTKPLGFGYQYTMENLEKYLQDAGHSIAATFAGENIYYLGSFYGTLGVTLAVLMVAFLYRFLCRRSILGGYGAVAVAIWLPTFYWGGMQAFSARLSLSVAPLVLLYLGHRAYLRARYGRRPLRGLGS